MKLAEAAVMQGLDRRTIELGVPGVVLMENAGKGTVLSMARHFGELSGRTVSIVVGPGNNGGDGFVIARHLLQLGARPIIFSLVLPEKIMGDALVNYKIVTALEIPYTQITCEADLESCRAVWGRSVLLVDAIFGTGLRRPVAGVFAQVIEAMNGCRRPIVAVDIASGLDSDSGKILGVCVNARLTTTYGLAKPGQFTYPGTKYTGVLEIVDIGIPAQVVEAAGISIELLERRGIAGLVPAREQESHKGSFGHLLLLAGSQGKTGAAILAAKASLRAGVGLVTLGVPQKLNDIFEKSLVEAMTIPLASEYFLGEEDRHAIAEALPGKSAVVLGPGIGLDPETSSLVSRLYKEINLPMVVDADGLNVLAQEKCRLRQEYPRILTPHPGEMARLVGGSTADIQGDRRAVASAFAVSHGVVVVLKGAATVIAAPDGRVAINPTGNAVMAAAGMGDVLAGVIGALLAQGLSAWDASCLGAYVHGLAADRIVAAHGLPFGILAGEVADELPLAFKEIVNGEEKC